MTIDAFYKAADLLRRKNWLEGILEEYTNAIGFLEKAAGCAIVDNSDLRLKTSAGEGVEIILNPHRPVKCGGLLQGFKEAAEGIRKELEEVDKEIADL